MKKHRLHLIILAEFCELCNNHISDLYFTNGQINMCIWFIDFNCLENIRPQQFEQTSLKWTAHLRIVKKKNKYHLWFILWKMIYYISKKCGHFSFFTYFMLCFFILLQYMLFSHIDLLKHGILRYSHVPILNILQILPCLYPLLCIFVIKCFIM